MLGIFLIGAETVTRVTVLQKMVEAKSAYRIRLIPINRVMWPA